LACCVVDTNVKKEANYELHKNLRKRSYLCRVLRIKALFEKVEILCFSCNGCHRSALG
jgi:hypothetical protein